jgi:hypothetical protein
MALSDFIRLHTDEIISAFEAFARTMMPPGANMVPSELRDHAQEMLTALIADMDGGQSCGEQSQKSMGMGSAHAMEASGHLHADARIRHGFNPRSCSPSFERYVHLSCAFTKKAVRRISPMCGASMRR